MRELELGDLESRSTTLSTPEEVDAYLHDHGDCLIFKAGACGRTDDALAEVRDALKGHPHLTIALVDVIASRSASRHLAHRARVEHASPQVILFRGGEVAYAQDNYRITAKALRSALDAPRPQRPDRSA
jgi:bacillithiol system protein YtxJ